jgi:hypothetical protein
MVLMMLSEYSGDLVTVFFGTIFCLLAFGDALSYLLTEFITYGTVLSRWCLGFVSFSHPTREEKAVVSFQSPEKFLVQKQPL